MSEENKKFNFDTKALIPILTESFLELAKDDIIIQKIIEKSKNMTEFTNCLMSGLICILDREKQNQEIIKTLVESNPQLKEILKEKRS